MSERTAEVADTPEPDLATGPVGAEDPLPLPVSASLIGEYRWIETALYRLLGGWVSDTPIAAVQVHLDAQSMRHAWHAELWGERLPVMAGSDPDELTRPSPPTAALFAVLSGTLPPSDEPGSSWPPAADVLIERPGVLPRLAGLYRVVLPRLVVTYQRHLRAATAVTDGPVPAGAAAGPQRRVSRTGTPGSGWSSAWSPGRTTWPPSTGSSSSLESVVVGAGASSGLVSVPGD